MSNDEISKLVEFADQKVYEHTGQQLGDELRYILWQSLLGKKLEEIELEGYTTKYVCKGKAQQLWSLLSEALGKKVNKRNVAGILSSLQAKQLRSQKAKSKPKTRLNGQLALNSYALGSKLMVVKPTLFSGAIFNLNNEHQREPAENPEEEVVQESLTKTAPSCSSKFKKFVKSGIPLFAGVGVCSAWYALSLLGNWYGAKSHLTGDIPQAQFAYSWVLRINPWSSAAHYNLGAVYEDQQNYKQARAEYQRAMELGLVAAYNNQARLYLLEGKYDTAISLLEMGLPLSKNEEPRIRYSFFKNRGWARLERGEIEEAKGDLDEAIALKDDYAAAHCLMAQVLECQGETKEALLEWENCLRYIQPKFPEENKWMRAAQQRLQAVGEGR
jgi:tetratricopeptide (TPR) repeat protein